MYADDVAIWSTSLIHLQNAIDVLALWSRQNSLQINPTKTKIVKFRRGGRFAEADTVTLEGNDIEFVSNFCYLGVHLHYSAISFTRHIRQRRRKALIALANMKNLHRLSVETALKLFDLKISPIISYGLQVIWSHLAPANFTEIEKIKATYLKRCLCLHKSTRNRILYPLCNTGSFVEELRYLFQLRETHAFEEFVTQFYEKQVEINPEFFATPAMCQNIWKQSEQSQRHILTRYSSHGFHHHICTQRGFHEAGLPTCHCGMCGEQFIGTYHLLQCASNTHTLAYYAT